ncbi:hypothetical protein HQ571_02725 [Candidatus Kuenenbacteria bacterium]|nr:hypothetical protein [Candidatus Kuenenbacteria bacterium]
MFDPNKPQTDPPKEESTSPELVERFSNKLKKEKSLDFMGELFKELPDLEFYLVGGMVRDTIIKHPTSKDYDFIARGVPIKKLVSALKKMGQVDFVGRNFGVLKFTPKDSTLKEAIDIALPRTELAEGTGGYRDVETKSDHKLPVEEDLARRDLTINAIAWNVAKQELVDPYNGQQDLENKTIRAVGKPEDRFQEDYSRMLRAVRFSCRFGFEIEPETWKAIQDLMSHINDQHEITIVESLERQLSLATEEQSIKKLGEKTEQQKKKDPDATKLEFVVPRETISTEILKSLKENPARALELLDESGALEKLLPETLEMKESDVWEHTKMMLKKINSPEFKKLFKGIEITGEFALGVLLHDISTPQVLQTPKKDGSDRVKSNGHESTGTETAVKIANRLRLSDFQTEKLKFMTKNHMFAMTMSDVFTVGANKFAKRFIDSPHSQDLLMLFYLDLACSVQPDETSPMKKFEDTQKRIEEIKAIREKQPEQIVDGNHVMQTLEIKGGSLLGVILLVLNEFADLGKINHLEDAIKFLEKNKSLLLKYQNTVTGQNREEVADKILGKLKGKR